MRHVHTLFVTVVLFLMIFSSACAPQPVAAQAPTKAPTVAPVPATEVATEAVEATTEATEAATMEATEAATEVSTEAAATGQAAEPKFPDFDAKNFGNPTVINNKWDPMKPGTFWAYEGTAINDEGNKVDRRIEFTVTDLTKEIEGVKTVVGWIGDYTDGQLTEKEIAFYAQDNDGNVWYFGEHPEDFEDGVFADAPTWIAGFQDARPGIVMMAEPQVGGPNIYQGWGPKVGWSDYGQVEQMGLKICVPVDCYQDVLVNAEANLDEKGAFQLKYFAPEVGEVEVGWKGTDQTKEELKLVEYKELSAEELAKIHAQALELDKNADKLSPGAYGETPPME